MTVPQPAASLVHELENGTLWLEVVGATGTLGQGQIARLQGQSFTRAALNGSGQVPPNPTTATGSCDILIMQDPSGFDRTSIDCAHNVLNARFGQLRQGGPGGPIIVDFSDQLSSPRQRGAFRSPMNRSDFLNGNVWGVIDEPFVGARVAGQFGPCWSGQQIDDDQVLCLSNNRFKVDAEVDLTVTDTQSGVTKTYSNPLNTPFQPILDTQALSTCERLLARTC